MRIVLDTNVWISALLFGGNPRKLIQIAQNNQLQIYASEVLLEELAEVLNHSKFQPRLQSLDVTSETLWLNVTRLVHVCQNPPSITCPELRDPDDIIVLQAAVAAQAIAVVSGDNDLLVLREFDSIPILTVTAFLDQYFPAF